jgi:diapolycopene oxygenase
VKKAIVVGSGIAGIATSIRLAALGLQVRVFEAGDQPGGKLSEFWLGPYRFDFGPSLFTMPELVTELYSHAGARPEDYFSFKRLPEASHYRYEDGTSIRSYSDPERFAAEVEEKLGVPAQRIHEYLDHSQMINRYTRSIFLNRSLHKVSSYLHPDLVPSLLHLPKMDVFSTMNEVNERRLKHPKLVQLFNRFATYNGSSPYKAPGILNVIPSLEHIGGAYFPEGGMYQITKGLYRLARDLGVEFHFNEAVERIEHSATRVTGAVTGKGAYAADVVVSNMDIVPSYRRLLPALPPPERILRQERSSSALVFYWGISRSFPQLGLHNIFFSRDYPEEFDQLFNKLNIGDDPTIYLNISSKEAPADAPSGHENWFLLVNAPCNEGQDWNQMVQRTRQNVLAKLHRMLGTDVAPLIEAEEVLEPRRLEAKTFSYKGSLYGTSSNNRYAAFFRHPNFHAGIRGLFFAGGSVHPGGGIPLCLLSAKITAGLVKKSL